MVLACVGLCGVSLDSSRSFRYIGPQLVSLRAANPEEPIQVVRHAFMFMYTANNCRVPENVHVLPLHPDGIDERAQLMEKLSPDLQILGSWDSIQDGLAVIKRMDADKAPANWELIDEVKRPKTVAVRLAMLVGGPIADQLNQSESKHEFLVYRVHPTPVPVGVTP